MEQIDPLPGRRTHRMTLDSEQEDRREEEERVARQQRQKQKQQKRKRKEEKRMIKQQQEKEEQLKAERQAEQRRQELVKFNDPAKLFEADSDSEANFSYAEKKIRRLFPKFNKGGKESDQQSDDDQGSQSGEQESESQSEQSSEEENSSQVKNKRKERKVEKKRNRQENDRRKSVKNNVNKPSINRVEQQLSPKDKLVQSLAIRWWYVMPQWPPVDYDYNGQLKKQGYRFVDNKDYRIADQVVDGLIKVCQLDGYRGVFKHKNGIIDVRPNQGKPCISSFNEKSEAELHKLVKLALQRQIEQLKSSQQLSEAQKQLLVNLKREHITH